MILLGVGRLGMILENTPGFYPVELVEAHSIQ